MSTPNLTSATAGANVLGWPDMPSATDPLPEEPAYVLWSPTGQESVFFYSPGSVEEHLVTEHGIDSLVVRRQAAGSYDHVGDHSKQTGVRTGVVGDLRAVGHAHEQAA
jgi:hypothetical protein